MAMSGIPGMSGPQAGISPQQMQEQQMIKYMNAAMESCVGKTALSGVMGFALGGVFGLFMSSMRYDTPLTAQGSEISKLPVAQQLRQGIKEMGRASFSSAKNFGIIGGIFSGTECCVTAVRAKDDMMNGTISGCITGGALAAKAGPQAAALGCAGFAAFSTAIEYYMRMPSNDPASDPIV